MSASSAPADFSRRTRVAVAATRRSCAHDWRVAGRQVSACSLCGDQFPCRGWACTHIDCIEHGIAMGRRKFPRSFPLPLSVIAAGHISPIEECPCVDLGDRDTHYTIRVDPTEPPETWTLPSGWRSV